MEVPMKRFLVFALCGALTLAGGIGLALGQNGGPPPLSKGKATKQGSPAPPGKGPPGKSPTQMQAPPKAQGKAPAKQGKGDNCFNLFNTGDETVNAYLMMLASHYAYPQALGMTNRDNATFSKNFEGTFRPFGMKQFQLVANAGVDPFPTGVQGTMKSWAVRAMVFSNDKVVVVSFRGSEMDLSQAPVDTFNNWVGTNIQTRLQDQPMLGPGVQVHDGFWTALDSVYKGVAAETAKQGGFKQKKVFVTGHSLGGALATLCALRLQKDNYGSPAVYTFASPRVGNDKFQAAFRLTHRRWVNQNDLVTQMPPEIFGYRPVGTFDHILANGKVQLNAQEGASPLGEVQQFVQGLADLRNSAKQVASAVSMHAPPLYSRALYNNVPTNLQGKMPGPPAK
jgi:triacylglycerol lipase